MIFFPLARLIHFEVKLKSKAIIDDMYEHHQVLGFMGSLFYAFYSPRFDFAFDFWSLTRSVNHLGKKQSTIKNLQLRSSCFILKRRSRTR